VPSLNQSLQFQITDVLLNKAFRNPFPPTAVSTPIGRVAVPPDGWTAGSAVAVAT
jgi:hypothetical protein